MARFMSATCPAAQAETARLGDGRFFADLQNGLVRHPWVPCSGRGLACCPCERNRIDLNQRAFWEGSYCHR
jgi:hypothetical protein